MSQSPADGPDGVPSWDAFSGEGPGCAPPPGPELAALLGEAVDAVDELDERQALGVGSAARRMRAHADYVEIISVARFGRVRAAQLEASKARGDRVRSRDGEYPAEELGFEMTASARSAGLLLDMAANIVDRLPATLAAMAAGLIDRDRARVISNATLRLSDGLAAEADKILADAAPGLRLADLQEKAARLEARLDPDGVRERKDDARHDRRVELRREDSGAASLSGRELDPAEAIAGKASIDAEAVRLRNAGLPGTLAQIRAAVLLDRIHQRSPWDRLAPLPEPEAEPDDDGDPRDDDPLAASDLPVDPDAPVDPAGHDYDDEEDDETAAEQDEEDEGRPAGFDGPPPGSPFDQAGRKTPLPALINITIPAGTLLGWSDAPADVGSWGLMDAETARALIEAASRHPRTRWCHTLTGPDGRATAHACARGTHPWTPPPPNPDGPSRDGPSPDGPGDPRLARLADLLAELNAAPEPIATGACAHAHREDRYIPSRKLKHLIRARTARCAAPGCGAQAITSEIDHTTPHPAGPSCQCNLGPLCKRHHHAKHAPGWNLQQTQPGVMRWTTPSGRTYTTHPTQYEELRTLLDVITAVRRAKPQWIKAAPAAPRAQASKIARLINARHMSPQLRALKRTLVDKQRGVSAQEADMRLQPHRRKLVVFSSPADPGVAHGASQDKRVARTAPIRRFLRIGMLLTVIAVRPRWRPLLAGAVLTILGVIDRQGPGSVLIIPGLLSFWGALMTAGDTDADRERRSQLKRELAAYSTPAQRCELVAVLDRYPDGITHEIRDILTNPPVASGSNGIPGR